VTRNGFNRAGERIAALESGDGVLFILKRFAVLFVVAGLAAGSILFFTKVTMRIHSEHIPLLVLCGIVGILLVVLLFPPFPSGLNFIARCSTESPLWAVWITEFLFVGFVSVSILVAFLRRM